MQVKDAQRLLAAAGYYKGGLDNTIGPLTREAMMKIIIKHRDKLTGNHLAWSDNRVLYAAAQIILNAAGHHAGEVDGLPGFNTNEAFAAWDYEQTHGHAEVVDRTPIRPGTPKAATKFPLQKDCPAFYGDPNKAEPGKRMVRIPTYRMIFSWDPSKVVTSIMIHEKCAAEAEEAFRLIEATYGLTRIETLGLHLYAGCYNPRPMRGGTAWSMHAFACAIDFNDAVNGLRTRCPEALFCGSAYKEFFDIWESVGFISLGREIGRDWMHVQAARLK